MIYHITPLKNIGKIIKDGIQPNKPQLWIKRQLGRFPKGYIYACTEYSDAVRWAFKTDWMLNEPHRLVGAEQIPVAIIEFKTGVDGWEDDIHIEGSGLDGKWIKSKNGVSPDQFRLIILPAQWKEIDVKNVVYK